MIIKILIIITLSQTKLQKQITSTSTIMTTILPPQLQTPHEATDDEEEKKRQEDEDLIMIEDNYNGNNDHKSKPNNFDVVPENNNNDTIDDYNYVSNYNNDHKRSERAIIIYINKLQKPNLTCETSLDSNPILILFHMIHQNLMATTSSMNIIIIIIKLPSRPQDN